MIDFFLGLYDFFQKHKRMLWGVLVASVALLLILISSLKYNENIYDFLPFGEKDKKAMDIYQDISHSDRIIVLFSLKDSTAVDETRLAEAVDDFADKLIKNDSRHIVQNLVTQIDFEKISHITDFVYDNIPILLTDNDYIRMEQKLAEPDYIKKSLTNDLQMMMLPMAGPFSTNISKDPLGLFSPVMQRLQESQASMPFDVDNGYIYTQDHKYAMAMMTTPFGPVESSNNGILIEYVDSVAKATTVNMADVKILLTGAPVIAVGNAKQIKYDSILAITIAVTLILALLVFSFRRFKSLMLIGFAITFGWLFAMGGISIASDNVSLIVLGIGSIIIGIAANYPLHFVAHGEHAESNRKVLKDMIAPLLVGNITTVGAFACLIPLDAPALHNLGIFAAFMLIGTILFVLIFLPHISISKKKPEKERLPFGKLAANSPDGKYWILALIFVMTLVFGYFSLSTSFDTNMQNINYMTSQQKEILQKLAQTGGIMDKNVYLVTEGRTWNEALNRRNSLSPVLDSLQNRKIIKMASSVTSFVCSKEEQQRRIDKWNSFWDQHRDNIIKQLAGIAPLYGFSSDAFDDFNKIVSDKYSTRDIEHFSPLTTTLLQSSFCGNKEVCSLVEVLNLKHKDVDKVNDIFNKKSDNHIYAFDIEGLNSSVANSLSDNFNYIGIACGIIVFFFLWLSFGRLELSLLAFLPMGVGWLWILGIMQLFDMQFNIVNIILATFIFGQGDDYTIFITDGLINEFAYRKKLLPSYKNSIIISALIMFVGMGALIVAKHPALHSLAEVTIIGMLTVVLMAWLLPPLIFGWIVRSGKNIRRVPVTLEQIVRMAICGSVYICELIFGTVLDLILFKVLGGGVSKERLFHRVIYRVMRFNIHNIFGVKSHITNYNHEDFSHPCIIAANHQSIIDPIWLLALSPKIMMIIGDRVWKNPLLYLIIRFAGFAKVPESIDNIKEYIASATSRGYSVVIFPEGARFSDNKVHHYHKGIFLLATELGIDILPIYIHGSGHVMSKGSGLACRGRITVEIGERFKTTELQLTYQDLTRHVHGIMADYYAGMCKRIESSHYYHEYIINKYLYKGTGIERETRKMLRQFDDYSKWIDGYTNNQGSESTNSIAVINAGNGQFSLLFALVHPDVEVLSYSMDEDSVALASFCDPMPGNLHVALYEDSVKENLIEKNIKVYLLSPDEELKADMKELNCIVINN